MSKEGLFCRLAGGLSGLLLVVGHLYPAGALLQVVALVPILYVLARRDVGRRAVMLAGMYMGFCYILPQLIALRLPVVMSLILLVHFTVLMVIFACGSAQLLGGSALAGSFAIGAFLVVLDWVNFTVVPIWGTAQSLGRPWSRYPVLIQFVSLTGITGIIFVLGVLQGLAVNIIIRSKQRGRLFGAGLVVVLVFAGVNVIIGNEQPAGKLKVAAVGWTSDDDRKLGGIYSEKGFEVLFAGPAARAADEGARLIVSPELGFCIRETEREKQLGRFAEIARRHNVFLAIGYFNEDENENRLLFMSGEGKVLSEYTKTYLTAFEDFRKGDGCLRIIEADGVRVGGMICQDDNFTRFSREYGRRRVGVMAVPTLDWRTVKGAHLQSSIHRALESRYAIVRAAQNGISAIISPKGEVLVSYDHFEEGPGAIAAEVGIYSSRTVFSILGHWLVVVSFVFLVVYTWWALQRRLLQSKSKASNDEGIKFRRG